MTAKAYLVLKQPTDQGGGAQISRLEFQFNPTQFSISKSASWNNEPVKDAQQTSMPHFTGAGPKTMTVDIFLDATDRQDKDLSQPIKTLFNCCTPVAATISRNHPSPPFVLFGWGTTMQFEAFVRSVSVSYLMFKPDGTPLRVKATVSLEEIPREAGSQNPTSGALATTSTHTLVEGDSLASIAYAEYGDPNLWRAVAEANKIDDPMRIRVGTTLLLPTNETTGPE